MLGRPLDDAPTTTREAAARGLPRPVVDILVQLRSGTNPMAEKTRRTRTGRDPLERTMEAALRPGRFIRYGESFAFVQGLERIARSIDGLVAEAPRGRQICSRPFSQAV